MPLQPGPRLGNYEVLSDLGSGGMGEVYKARDLKLGRDVAIKVLPQERVSDSDRLRRFEQEARAASALNHPNIASCPKTRMEPKAESSRAFSIPAESSPRYCGSARGDRQAKLRFLAIRSSPVVHTGNPTRLRDDNS